MLLHSLALSNFRSYKKVKFDFSPKTTIIIGDNACGKTNLLEAIFLLSLGKSFRASKEQEMVHFGKELGRVTGELDDNNQEESKPLEERSNSLKLEVVITGGVVAGIKAPVKKYSVNGVTRRVVDFAGRLKIVLFWPEDMELITGSPGKRRNYLDFVLLQTDHEYRRSLISYEKGLRQRNKLLGFIREGMANRYQLAFWDQLLIKDGEYITTKREEYINFINNYSQNNLLTDTFGLPAVDYQLVYDKSIISKIRLAQYEKEEVGAGVTLVGPHRDDIKYNLKEISSFNNLEYRNLSHFGSRGEQRLAVLWLKIGELLYIKDKSGQLPLLLLDDIFSELDHEHQKIIFKLIGKQQTIMTTADSHFIDRASLKEAKIIEL